MRKITVKLLIFLLCSITILLSLGFWQIERRAWKLDLINKVETRAHAEPQQAPGPDVWDHVNKQDDEYKHVFVEGKFLNKERFVQASTIKGPGFWVLAPFTTSEGSTFLINRGFVPSKQYASGTDQLSCQGVLRINGLLRITEPEGTLLRKNIPNADKWYSRDVAALARSLEIEGKVAPYFIDADATNDCGPYPVGGLTVISFYNHHLIYALTWFGLAGLLMFTAYKYFKDKDD